MNTLISTHVSYHGKQIAITDLKPNSQLKVLVVCPHGERLIRWNRRHQLCRKCRRLDPDYKQNLSNKMIGREITWGDKISKAKRGIKATETHKKALSMAQYRITNEEDWPGFYAKSEVAKLRDSIEYKNFRETVLKRDNYTCRLSGKKGHLIVHHLDGVSLNKATIFDIDNGITLHIEVHKLFHSVYGNGQNTKEQFSEFTANFDKMYVCLVNH